MDKNTAIDYQALEVQRANELNQEVTRKLEQAAATGRIDSLRHVILRYVVEGNYEMAHSELDRYGDQQKNYGNFENRTKPFFKHCHDSINAIRTKRNLPGTGGISMAKNQELLEKVMEHFEELKHYLKKIEIVQKEVKIDDLRSTVIVVKVFFHCVFALFAVAFLRSILSTGFTETFNVVMDDTIEKLVNAFTKLF